MCWTGMEFIFFFGHSNSNLSIDLSIYQFINIIQYYSIYQFINLYQLISGSYSHIYRLNDSKIKSQNTASTWIGHLLEYNLKCKLKRILTSYFAKIGFIQGDPKKTEPIQILLNLININRISRYLVDLIEFVWVLFFFLLTLYLQN